MEMERSVDSFVGYREMTKRLRKKHNLVVRRDTIMRAMRVIDPDGVNARKRRRLKRHQYNTPGPNFLCHIDGWDKLKPYGFSGGMYDEQKSKCDCQLLSQHCSTTWRSTKVSYN